MIVDFRPRNPAAGVRPALVVQNDLDNSRMGNTVVVQVTTKTKRSAEPTQLLIDAAHPDWPRSGLRHPSVVNCSAIYTIDQDDVARIVGSLSAPTLDQIDNCLRTVLDLN